MGVTCPTKLFYMKDPEYSVDEKQNEYLTALAESGILVEHIVRKFFPDGVLVTANSTDEAVANTKKLLETDNICLFEPTFLTDKGLLARVDILVKKGNYVELIEVKSKSINPAKDSILDKRSKIIIKLSEKFKQYVFDVAFQTHVFNKCYPQYSVTPYLCFLDKTKSSNIKELINSFALQLKDGNIHILDKLQLTYPSIKEAFVHLLNLNHDELIKNLFEGKIVFNSLMETNFNGHLNVLLDLWLKNDKFSPKVGAQCEQCEFRTFGGKKSGFYECWSTTKGLTLAQCQEPFCFDLWQCSKEISNKLIEEGKIFIKNLSENDLKGAYASRQSLIIDKIKSNSTEESISLNIKSKLTDLKFPLHFIDFEIARLPIPTCLGMKPYQLIPFQFSIHHIDNKNLITHKQYIDIEKGYLPIIDFIDELILHLSIDDGKILHYSNFEVAILKEIEAYLYNINPDQNADRINNIVKIISRCVDLQKIIVEGYYHPKTLGSNSIKDVLPAILSTSELLKSKYSNAIYGYETNIHSLNFSSIAWIQSNQNGDIKDPYSLLPPLLKGFDNKEVEKYDEDEEIRNHGGAAMLAYSRAQYFDVDQTEIDRLKDALLKYCELDTFAMVMIWEHLNSVAN